MMVKSMASKHQYYPGLLPALIGMGLMGATTHTLAAASLEPTCLKGCLPIETDDQDQSAQLLFRDSTNDAITLRWMSQEAPFSGDGEVLLYAGNPLKSGDIPLIGTLPFELDGGRYLALKTFEGSSLGKGTFLTILTHKKGNRETILDWRAWRLVTRQEHAQEQQAAAPETGYELNVTARALRAESPRGPLPMGQGGDASSWWSLQEVQDQKANLDLDGDSTGIPGLGVQISAPWHAGEGELNDTSGSGSAVQAALSSSMNALPGHEMHFESLTWRETADRTLELEQEANALKLQLRHYYTVVTLWTNATVRAFNKQEVIGFFGLFDRTFFAHETSAHLKVPRDPRFWASYSRREYGSDPHLLELLRDQVEDHKPVPGLSEVQRQDGDGGPTTFHIALQASAHPWSLKDASEPKKSAVGIVAAEVVASRAGYGRMLTQGSAGQNMLEEAWAKVSGKTGEAHSLDLDDPPDGFFTSAVAAQTATKSGVLPLLQAPLQLAQRGLDTPPSESVSLQTAAKELPGLQSLVQSLKSNAEAKASPADLFERLGFHDAVTFPLSATLRAGALVEGKAGGSAINLVPINAYAQYVVKLTVAMLPEQQLAVTTDAQVVGKDEHDNVITGDKKAGSGLPSLVPEVKTSTKLYMVLATVVVGLIALVVLVFAVPGLRTFLSGWLRFLTPKDRDNSKQ